MLPLTQALYSTLWLKVAPFFIGLVSLLHQEREKEAGGEGEPGKGAKSDATDEAKDRETLAELQVKRKKYSFQPQWLTQNPFCIVDSVARLLLATQNLSPGRHSLNLKL